MVKTKTISSLRPILRYRSAFWLKTYLQSIVASVITEDQSENAVNQVKTILERTHNIAADQENNFNVFSQQELISTFSSTSEMLTILLVAIASISLIVGGIGIMNIMYVSVKERTKEIGCVWR